MFDVGFTELLVIALVALIVIGPERLPKVARTVGVLLGRLQRYVSDVKSDINREIQLDELKKIQEQVSTQARELEDSMTSDMRAVEDSLNQTIAPPQMPAADPEVSAKDANEAKAAKVANAPTDSAVPAGIIDPVSAVAEQQLELGLDATAGKATG